ncbi:MAG: CU044_5270 family protein [Dactylosporangium sp.]|nr:CU044_5270 family protein [Dactylosporangium sp.]NNJ62506.1 CU044_5270 family protein [Dactylosporangium sp.]
MDDMQLVRELGNQTPLVGLADLAPARARLAAEIASATFSEQENPMTHSTADTPASSESGTAPVRSTRRRRLTPRFVWLQAALGSVAALAVTAVVVQGVGGDSAGTTPPAGSSGTAQKLNLTAVEVLNNAATQVLTAPDVTPRGDQFFYIKQTAQVRGTAGGTFEYWFSIDGTRDGLQRISGAPLKTPGPVSTEDQQLPEGKTPESPAPQREEDPNGDSPIRGCPASGTYPIVREGTVVDQAPCSPDPAYQDNLPTDAAGMLAHLRQRAEKTQFPIIKEAEDIAVEYLRPQSRAALFQALTKIEGVQVVENVTDGAGRPGVGIEWGGEATLMMVFDQKTFVYLGTDAQAVMAMGIVDQVGQLP